MDMTWVKSSHSATSGNCVEVARNAPGLVAVRDSQDPHGPVLRLSRAVWRQLVERIKSGR
ncbi:MAG TPA: DUF397 domain-containing protein [Streptosporangiaceae bacterium]|jgi:hypothetical protein